MRKVFVELHPEYKTNGGLATLDELRESFKVLYKSEEFAQTEIK